MPADAPTEFIKKRWGKLVLTDDGLDRRYYELCAISELKNTLRSGDIWVQGSRQFKYFDEYLVKNAHIYGTGEEIEKLVSDGIPVPVVASYGMTSGFTPAGGVTAPMVYYASRFGPGSADG